MTGRLAIATAVVLLVTAAPAWGQLDPSFGGRGWVSTFEVPFGSGTQPREATDVVVQPDGRIVVTASGTTTYGGQWIVVRYLPDGRPDPGFGQGGSTVIGGRAHGDAAALALQPDGKIVVVGSGHCEEACFTAARLNPDGSLDASFGTGGIVSHDPVRRTTARAVAVQPDGRIVMAGGWYRGGGTDDDDAGCVMRLLPDGRLDPSFSGDGVVRLEHGYGDDHVTDVAVQGRRIVVAGAGRSIAGQRGRFAVVRFRPNGGLDRSFGHRGRRFVGFGRGRWASADALSTAPGGRLVIAGNTGTGYERWQPAIARLTRGGSLDRRFGSGGRVRVRVPPFGGDTRALAVDARGRVLLAGRAYADASWGDWGWALVRYTAAGRPDPAAGPDGVVRGGVPAPMAGASAIGVAGDRAVVAGGSGSVLAVARYVLP
jgi:uncharacterized delta-60 repeat protein